MQTGWTKIVAFFTSVLVWFSSFAGLGEIRQNADLLIHFPDYFIARKELASLPGLEEGFVPQGITYLTKEDVYLLCGYMDDETASRLYVLKDGTFTGLSLLHPDGSDYTGHAGGITAAGDYVYVSNNKRLYVLDRQSVLSAEDGDTVAFLGSVGVPCRASFCSSDGERVYVGEYHKEENYPTDPSHTLTAPDGSVFQALVFGYTVSPEAPFGLLSETPAAAYSMYDEIQGFAMLPDGIAALSCSDSSVSSGLHFFDCSGAADGYFSLEDAEIPLWYLTDARAVEKIKIPRMSEDIEFRSGDILIIFESGARKFEPKDSFTETDIVRLSVKALLPRQYFRRCLSRFFAPEGEGAPELYAPRFSEPIC